MARLRGTGLGAGMAMGSAAIVRVQGGVPLMPEVPARIAALAAQRKLTEMPEVILVAEELRTALAIEASLPWARVAGIVTERAAGDVGTPSIPTVTGLVGLMQAAAEDVLILVDATRGIVLVDPDPIYLAQYTAEHDRVAPKHRIYLDDQHQPAKTLEGRTITVIADASDGVEAALGAGPDALFFALPLLFDPDDVRRRLFDLLTTAAGKPLFIPDNASLPLQPILEAATRADVTVIVSPQPGEALPRPEAITRLMDEAELSEADFAKRDVICARPRIAAEIDLREMGSLHFDVLESRMDGLAAAGVTRLVATAVWNEDTLEFAAQAATISGTFLVPLICSVDGTVTGDAFASIAQRLIEAGAAGLIVSTARASAAKAIVRAV